MHKPDRIIITMVGLRVLFSLVSLCMSGYVCDRVCIVKGDLYQVYWPTASAGQIQTAKPRTTNPSTEH